MPSPQKLILQCHIMIYLQGYIAVLDFFLSYNFSQVTGKSVSLDRNDLGLMQML